MIKILCLAVLALVLTGCKSPEEKSELFYQNAKGYLAEQKYGDAEIEFRNALRENSYNAKALLGLAEIFEHKKQWDNLEKALVAVLEQDRNNIAARTKLTAYYLGVEDAVNADKHSVYLSEVSPQDNGVKILRAAVLFKLSKHAEARAIVDAVLRDEPRHLDALILKAYDLFAQDDFVSAIKLLEYSVTEYPLNSTLNFYLIDAYERVGETDKALTALERLNQHFPNTIQYTTMLANKYASNGKTQAALNLLERAAASTQNPEYLIQAASLHYKFGGLQSAEKAISTYLNQYPAIERLRFAYTDILIEGGAFDRALALLHTMWDEKNSDSVRVYAGLKKAQINLVRKDYVAASAIVRTLKTLAPENTDVAIVESLLLAENNDSNGAIRVLRTALRYSPDNPNLYITLAQTHADQGHWELANDYYIKALHYDGGGKYLSGYVKYLISRGELERAESLLLDGFRRGQFGEQSLELYAQLKLVNKEWDGAGVIASYLEKSSIGEVQAAYIRTLAARGKNDTSAALAAISDLRQFAPQRIEPIILLVDTYVKSGNRAAAESVVSQLAETPEGKFVAAFLAGEIHAYFQEWALAKVAFERAIVLEPGVFTGYDALINVLFKLANPVETEAFIDKTMQQFPNNQQVLRYKASVLEAQGQKDALAEIYRRMLQNDNGADLAANNLAVILLEMGGAGNLREAASVAERFRQSKQPQFLDTLGWVYVKQSKLGDGMALLRRANEALPNTPEIQFHLAYGHYKLGDYIKARAILDRALASAGPDDVWLDEARSLMLRLDERVQ